MWIENKIYYISDYLPTFLLLLLFFSLDSARPIGVQPGYVGFLVFLDFVKVLFNCFFSLFSGVFRLGLIFSLFSLKFSGIVFVLRCIIGLTEEAFLCFDLTSIS